MDTIRGRLLRSWVIAMIAVGLGAVAHGAAGASVPAPDRLLVVTVVAAVAAFPFYRRSTPGAALVPLLGLAQLVLHPAFVWAGDEPAAPHAGHGAHAAGWLMLAAHAAAGLLAAALVVLTDRLLAAALRPRRCRLLLTAVLPVEPSTATAGPRAVAPIVTGRLAEFVVRAPRRGPPPIGAR